MPATTSAETGEITAATQVTVSRAGGARDQTRDATSSCAGHASEVTGDAATGGPPGPHGYTKQRDQHLKRLRRIEGQIRGLQRMVDEDVYCIDILTQVSASTKALQSFALQLLEEHLRHCVADAAVRGGEEADTKVAEATAAIARLLRT
ncbi:metal-sensitive transcriptional regulator [Streptomyces buecherae]|uniref:Metal-sensitive transcriptional regulator n=1 Tax=Streptomyces buecherae TaxID=2763006 RepID=A0A7H8NJ21_9ACTN|nr:metal-sensitive transcriptional regulator [Streptomyces buecherae]